MFNAPKILDRYIWNIKDTSLVIMLIEVTLKKDITPCVIRLFIHISYCKNYQNRIERKEVVDMLYIHRVKKDESLKDICVKYSVFSEDLLHLNNITEENVKEGLLMVIDIPEGKRYVVKPFDTLAKIADKFKTTEEKLMQFNNISQVFLGQIIYIPD